LSGTKTDFSSRIVAVRDVLSVRAASISSRVLKNSLQNGSTDGFAAV
jgi:hypothetical protein